MIFPPGKRGDHGTEELNNLSEDTQLGHEGVWD